MEWLEPGDWIDLEPKRNWLGNPLPPDNARYDWNLTGRVVRASATGIEMELISGERIILTLAALSDVVVLRIVDEDEVAELEKLFEEENG